MQLARVTERLYDAALALLYPQACAVCEASVERREDGAACAACWQATRLFSGEEVMCGKCGLVLAEAMPQMKRAEARCRRCDDESYTAARSCGVYEKALRASVLALKREPYVAPRVARMMFEAQQRSPLNTATRIVPVPLHPERERERGFNQAAVLARSLAAQTGLTCDEWSLARTLHTARHRAGMDAQARRETVERAFEVPRPRLIAGQRILLIDDVYTTGATVASCATALNAAGAEHVFVLTIARAGA
ncbi:MAG: double zinc ribbon domain-containing protein [Pyrinomonadaceae bacterium]